jgi:hypothetical protein
MSSTDARSSGLRHATIHFDEDSMSRGLVEALRLRNVDVETATDAGLVPASDEEHLAYATAAERVLYFCKRQRLLCTSQKVAYRRRVARGNRRCEATAI